MSTNDVPRLDWASKPKTVERVALPFQIVETINESRATREAHRGSLFGPEAPASEDGWRNKLIWGDNKPTAIVERWLYYYDSRDLFPYCPPCAKREFADDAPASGDMPGGVSDGIVAS